MSWLRLDDKFAQHPKVLALTDREFRVHVRALCYAAEYRTDGRIPDAALRPIGASSATVVRLVDLGLWDTNGRGLEIHDFRIYNPADPTAAERKARSRSRKSHGEVTDESR